jgi:hypothetical protein
MHPLCISLFVTDSTHNAIQLRITILLMSIGFRPQSQGSAQKGILLPLPRVMEVAA